MRYRNKRRAKRDGVTDAAYALIQEIQKSDIYKEYREAKESASRNEAMWGLYLQDKQLQLRIQANTIAGTQDEELLRQHQRIYEVLQFDETISTLLLAECRVYDMLGKIYKQLANAIDASLIAFEDS